MSDFTPTPGQSAHADQRLAAARNSVRALVDKVRRGQVEQGHPLPVAAGLLAIEEVGRLVDTVEAELPAALAMLGVAIVELAERDS